MKTKLFVVRHTETIGNIKKRLTGRKDYELTERGKEIVMIIYKMICMNIYIKIL